ncbi:NAD(+) diphosphatase [Rhodobacteraceae bacterium CCMM004]|nr:NAD(+) diphosphatase [Rhodobacteraceae bacterium CCMM004]
MRRAESVTFGGSGLDRAAHLRGDAGALADLRRATGARVLPLWRGKPALVPADGGETLGWVSADAQVLEAAELTAFLGLDDGGPRFAADVSAWAPPDLPDTLDSFTDRTEQRHPEQPEGHRFVELRAAMTRLDARAAELAATAKALFDWHRIHGFCARCGVASTVAMGGWQRDCPACGAHHFPRTDPVVIMLVTQGNDLLIGRSPHWPEGMYSLLAGFVEPGETMEAAVRREVWEEAGVRVGRVDYLASQPWPFPASLMMGCHGHATSREIVLDPVELEHALWVGREEAMAIAAGDHPRINPARKGAIAQFLIHNWLADTLD